MTSLRAFIAAASFASRFGAIAIAMASSALGVTAGFSCATQALDMDHALP